jgi:hypothetical protein
MNKAKISVIALLLTAYLILGCGIANDADNFVGVTDIRNDKRVIGYTGYLLEEPVMGYKSLYGGAIILTRRNDYHFLIHQNISEDPKIPIWKVVSQFKAPAIEDENYIYIGSDCIRNGERDRKIIALILYDKDRDKELLDKVEKAWYLNTKSLLIEPISPEGIVCNNPDYGL